MAYHPLMAQKTDNCRFEWQKNKIFFQDIKEKLLRPVDVE